MQEDELQLLDWKTGYHESERPQQKKRSSTTYSLYLNLLQPNIEN